MERVAFDTSAWFEVLAENPSGKRLSRDYLNHPEVRVLTPSFALGEMSAKLARHGAADRIPAALTAMDAGSEVVHLSTRAAMQVGPLLLQLRKVDKDASMVDAAVLAIARDHGAKLVSTDPAFEGQADVLQP